jgi:hypothetical protein
MTWFKVDDGLHSHRKAVRAGVPAMGLWVLAGSWCADHLSDGFIPDYMAARLDPDCEQNAARLVDVGLWVTAERGGDKGWQFHDWVEQQPTREQVLAERKANAARQERFRQRANAKRAAAAEAATPTRESRQTNTVSNAVTDGVTNGPVTPTRPDPTRPTTSNEVVEGPPQASAATTRSSTKGTRIPKDFYATDEMIQWARENTPNVGAAETAAFIDHFTGAAGQRGVKTDWVATWRNWMRREQKRIEEQRSRFPNNGAGYTARNGVTESNAPKRIPADQRCPTHPNFPATTCSPCRADRLAGDGARAAVGGVS